MFKGFEEIIICASKGIRFRFGKVCSSLLSFFKVLVRFGKVLVKFGSDLVWIWYGFGKVLYGVVRFGKVW